jgi:hypothetical protein
LAIVGAIATTSILTIVTTSAVVTTNVTVLYLQHSFSSKYKEAKSPILGRGSRNEAHLVFFFQATHALQQTMLGLPPLH